MNEERVARICRNHMPTVGQKGRTNDEKTLHN